MKRGGSRASPDGTGLLGLTGETIRDRRLLRNLGTASSSSGGLLFPVVACGATAALYHGPAGSAKLSFSLLSPTPRWGTGLMELDVSCCPFVAAKRALVIS